MRSLFSSVLAITAILGATSAGSAADPQIERGKYLVTLGGCSDCHTPGYFLGKPDMSHTTSAVPTSNSQFRAWAHLSAAISLQIKDTGLGNWTTGQIIAALTTGVRPDGRQLAPIMPWEAFSHLTSEDAQAIAAYLKSLPPVNHAVPGPFGPNEKPSTLVFVIVPGDVYVGLPKPPPP